MTLYDASKRNSDSIVFQLPKAAQAGRGGIPKIRETFIGFQKFLNERVT